MKNFGFIMDLSSQTADTGKPNSMVVGLVGFVGSSVPYRVLEALPFSVGGSLTWTFQASTFAGSTGPDAGWNRRHQ